MKKRRRTFLLALLIVFGPAILAIWFLHVTRDLRAQREEGMQEAEQSETTQEQPSSEDADKELATTQKPTR